MKRPIPAHCSSLIQSSRRRVPTALVRAIVAVMLVGFLLGLEAVAVESPGQERSAAPREGIPIHWLDGKAPGSKVGVSFGVPWKKGQLRRQEALGLLTERGEKLPIQTWVLATWPDGSVKWSGIATVAGRLEDGAIQLVRGVKDAATPTGASEAIRIRRSETALEVDTGALRCRVVRWGSGLIDSLVVGEKELGGRADLVCLRENSPPSTDVPSTARERYLGRVKAVEVEQDGPVRAVLRITGVHRGEVSAREWLPFVVRLYFYAGSAEIRIVHTIIFDGDPERDFIRGLGLRFSVPMREQIHNRHIRFGGEGRGVWAEPIQPMKGRDGRFAADPVTGSDVFPVQARGKRVPNRDQFSPRSRGWLDDWAAWRDFKLVQSSARGFLIQKRTNAASAWLSAGEGGAGPGDGLCRRRQRRTCRRRQKFLAVPSRRARGARC